MSANEKEEQSQKNTQNSETASPQPLKFKLSGTRYVFSGEINIISWLFVITIGLIPLFFAAYVYANFTHNVTAGNDAGSTVTSIFLRLVLPVLFGFFIGSVYGFLGQIMNVRNPFTVFFTAVIMSLIGIYFVWITRLLIFSEGKIISANPITIFYLMQAIIDKYAIDLSHNCFITGNYHIGLWIIETGTILFFTSVTVEGIIDSIGYCESCNSWTNTEWNSPMLAAASPIDESELFNIIELSNRTEETSTINLSFFIISPEQTVPTMYYTFSINSCSCGSLNLLTLSKTTITEEKGKKEQTSQTLLHNFALTPSSYKSLKAQFMPEV